MGAMGVFLWSGSVRRMVFEGAGRQGVAKGKDVDESIGLFYKK